MRWKLIFLLSLFSVAMSLATVYHILPSGVEQVIWLLILIFCAVVIAKNASQKLFLHGFLLCIINAVWQTVIHAALFDTFTAHNQDMVEKFKNVPMDQFTLMIIMGLTIGVVSGVVTGLLAMLAGKFIKPPAPKAG